jgi:hypothetical protein
MSYVLKGRLCGFLCAECQEPLANVVVRLYAPATDERVTPRAAAQPKDTFTVLTVAQARKRGKPIAEATADADGAFTIELDEKAYAGGAFEVDVYCPTVARPHVAKGSKAVQFSITTLQPAWRQVGGDLVAAWEYCLPARFWCSILALFGVWTICGRLLTCDGKQPIPGAVVSAFDADWLQDDPLGSDTTDFGGHFLISYTRDDFEKTPLTPWGVNVEWVGGPDVYFEAKLGGSTILQETQADGRAPGRENAGPCLCVELCTDDVVVGDGPETIPHWQQVEVFDIHPTPGTIGAQFLVEGYAGSSTQAYVFGGGVTLKGNCPLRNIATGNPLEYRFTIGEWTWSPPGDDPSALPSVPPGAQTPATQVQSTRVGYVFYTDGNGMAASHPVDVTATDGPDGWVQLQGRPVTVPMYNPPGSTAVVNVDHTNFLRTFDLLVLNSPAITALHPAKLPGQPPSSEAGRSLLATEKEPIRRYRLQFEVRDAVTLAPLPGDTLASIILDNSPVIRALNLVELQADACNPLGGASQVHVQYTLDHPHLREFSISIANNNGTVHPPPAHSGSPTVAMPSGSFAPGSFFFRGGASGTGGVAVGIGADPSCAYSVTLSWLTRRWQATTHSTQVLYCK